MKALFPGRVGHFAQSADTTAIGVITKVERQRIDDEAVVAQVGEHFDAFDGKAKLLLESAQQTALEGAGIAMLAVIVGGIKTGWGEASRYKSGSPAGGRLTAPERVLLHDLVDLVEVQQHHKHLMMEIVGLALEAPMPHPAFINGAVALEALTAEARHQKVTPNALHTRRAEFTPSSWKPLNQ